MALYALENPLLARGLERKIPIGWAGVVVFPQVIGRGCELHTREIYTLHKVTPIDDYSAASGCEEEVSPYRCGRELVFGYVLRTGSRKTQSLVSSCCLGF